MRLPNRKPGKYTFAKFDPHMTEEKLNALKERLEKIKKVSRPQAIKETKQYAENGDFSENAEYQIAKGRLRGLNRTIDELEHQIAHAVIIQAPTDAATIRIGHTVTISIDDNEVTFTILGPTETNPTVGIISYQSPLGAALIGHKVGDTVSINDGKSTYQIVYIE